MRFYSLKIATMWLLMLVFIAQGAMAKQLSGPYETLADAESATKPYITVCQSVKSDIVHIETSDNHNVLCVFNDIDASSIKAILELGTKFDVVVANTAGGDVLAAMDLGRHMYANNTDLIVNGICISSCANYLIPAAENVVILDNSAVVMHGSIPRDSFRFLDMKVSALGFSKDDIAKDFSIYKTIMSEYPEHIEKFIMPEVRYFTEIGKSEDYIRNYSILSSRLRNHPNHLCRPKKGMFTVLGPKYFELYRIDAPYIWWPADNAVFKTILHEYIENYDVVLELDSFATFRVGDENTSNSEDCRL